MFIVAVESVSVAAIVVIGAPIAHVNHHSIPLPRITLLDIPSHRSLVTGQFNINSLSLRHIYIIIVSSTIVIVIMISSCRGRAAKNLFGSKIT